MNINHKKSTNQNTTLLYVFSFQQIICSFRLSVVTPGVTTYVQNIKMSVNKTIQLQISMPSDITIRHPRCWDVFVTSDYVGTMLIKLVLRVPKNLRFEFYAEAFWNDIRRRISLLLTQFVYRAHPFQVLIPNCSHDSVFQSFLVKKILIHGSWKLLYSDVYVTLTKLDFSRTTHFVRDKTHRL